MSGQACNLIKKIPTQMFPYEICKTFNITFIYRTLPVTFRKYLWKTNLKFRLISYRHMFSKIFGYLQKQQFLSVKLLYFLVYIISVIFSLQLFLLKTVFEVLYSSCFFRKKFEFVGGFYYVLRVLKLGRIIISQFIYFYRK